MAITIPYSAIVNQNLIPVNSTNFPALKHFFKCNEATNAVSLTDSIGGLVVNGDTAQGLTNNGDGTLNLSADTWTTIASGTIANPGAKNVLLLWGGKPTAATGANIIFGGIATNAHRGVISTAQTATGGKIMADGSVTVTITNATKLAGTGSQYQTRALACTWHTASVTGVMREHDFDGTTATSESATIASGTASDSLTGMVSTAIDQAIGIGAGSNPGFIQMWHLTTMPTASQILAAISWTHYYAFTAPYNKYVFPGFRGIT